ncbi:MAG: virulence RhuM family protein [Dysgonamonadaceae bacterium]|jgi:hypothetical protein|nr:virulence RhuM family protein [Dysgonamonadaceae bacterium]
MNEKAIQKPDSEIKIYKTTDGIQLDVKLDKDTVWLNQNQMIELFQASKQNVSLHINNIFKEGELNRQATVKEYLTVRQEGERSIKRNIEHYSLDVIISVGYRIKSQRGTEFRIWANSILKEYIVKGYAINQRVKNKQFEDLKNTVKLLSNVIDSQRLTADEATGLLNVITDYTYALDTLDKYDYQSLEVDYTTKSEPFRATYENAIEAIKTLQEKFGSGGLFANEKDESFKSSVNTIYQTFGGEDLYPSIEEKDIMVKVVVNLINKMN